MDFDFKKFERKGLYLVLENSSCIAFTDNNIKKIAFDYWNNKISSNIKKSVNLKKCDFCLLKNDDDICPAIKPIFPLIDVIKEYNSFDNITAIYTDAKKMFHISYTTMQEALKYLSMISLFEYCLISKKYSKYYYGINPLSTPDEIAKKLYINIFWFNKNSTTRNFIEEFTEKITITSSNQIKRLHLVCEKDSLVNAYVNTQLTTALMSIDIEKSIQKDI